MLNPYISFPASGVTPLPQTIFYLHDGDATPDARDQEVHDYLEGLGWTVDFKSEESLTAPSDLDGYGILMIANSVVEGAVADRDAALDRDIGVIWLGPRIETDHQVDAISTTSASETQLYIDNITHPITSHLSSTGLLTVYTSGTKLNYNTGPGGTILARQDTGTGDPCFWVYDKGEARTGSGTYAGRRVVTWIGGQGGQRLDTGDGFGQVLLSRACDWATYRL